MADSRIKVATSIRVPQWLLAPLTAVMATLLTLAVTWGQLNSEIQSNSMHRDDVKAHVNTELLEWRILSIENGMRAMLQSQGIDPSSVMPVQPAGIDQ